ncbi:MAG: hypothetical protein LAP87_00820 [Acidobacteriia bacterium]|nr:hypothetical protein [Terriglobia bacterium]
MPTGIATIVFALGIWGLFLLDRDRRARTSPALWIPVAWMWIAGSRAVSLWLAAFGWGDAPGPAMVDQYMDGSPVDRNVLSVLLALALAVLIRRRRQVGTILRANSAVLVFFLYCAVSVIWSDYPDVAFKRWTKALGDVAMLMVVLTDPDRSAALKRFLARTTFLLIPLSVLLIKYYPALGREYNAWSWMPVYGGVTTNKNTLGMICLLFGLGSVWRLLAAYRDRSGGNRIRQMIAHGAILAMVVWLFSVANSMTSLLCFTLAGGMIVATSFSAVVRKPLLVHLSVIGIILLCSSVLFFGLGGDALEAVGRDPTLTGRTAIWGKVLAESGNPLFGTGFESFWLGKRLDKLWNVLGMHLNQSHNGYLETYLNLGWVGVMLLAFLIVKGYRNVMAALRRDPDTGRLWLAYFTVAVIYNFTEATIKMMSPIWILFLLATIAVPKISSPKLRLLAPRVRRSPLASELPAPRTYSWEEGA